MPLAPGARLGSYEVLGPLGAGGMGEVFRARDTKLGREVALKLLPEGLASSPERLSRLEREARTLASLHHPHVATLFAFEEHDSRRFLVMELVPGETLAERIARGPIPLREALTLFRQIAEGLEAAHDKGIVHRDLKPANIKITPDGQAKVLDFGLAKNVEPPSDPISSELPTESHTGTTPGVVVGTAAYMSPEQARGLSVDRRTDVWAFGACLYEALTGRRPFAGATLTDVLAQVLEREPDWDALPKDLPPAVRLLVRRCLRKDRNERLRDVADARLQLEDSLEAARGRTPATGGERAAGPRRLWLVSGAVLALVIALAALAWRFGWTTRGGRPGAGGPAAASIRSLAVLPLANLSNDKEQQYFVDGMHEELSTQLQKLGAGGVKVISRMSTLGYKDNPKPPAEIGRELNVEGLVGGSVRRVGNHVAIAVQLVRAATGESLWAESYQRDVTDVLLLQTEIAQAIARAIGAALAPGPRGTAKKVNPDAYDAYLRGRRALDFGTTADSLVQAKAWFEKAIALDPGLALAYSGLGNVYLGLGAGNRLRRHDAYVEAEKLMERAIALEDTPETRYPLALLRANTRHAWGEFFKASDELLAVNPGDYGARAGLSWMLSYLGRHDEAIQQSRKVIELNPLCGAMCELDLGIQYYRARRYAEALPICRSVTERQPDASLGWACLSSILFHTGSAKEAVAAMDTAAKLEPDFRRYLAVYYAFAGRTTEARRILAGLEKDWAAGRPVSPVTIGMIHMALGEKEQVFPWIERGFDDYDMELVLLHDPDWDPIRDDPRFQWAMRRRAGQVQGPYVAGGAKAN